MGRYISRFTRAKIQACVGPASRNESRRQMSAGRLPRTGSRYYRFVLASRSMDCRPRSLSCGPVRRQMNSYHRPRSRIRNHGDFGGTRRGGARTSTAKDSGWPLSWRLTAHKHLFLLAAEARNVAPTRFTDATRRSNAGHGRDTDLAS